MAIDDNFGIETSYGTGRHVSQCAKILKAGKMDEVEEINISVILTMDSKEKKYEEILKNYFKKYKTQKDVNFTIYNIIGNTIYRCIACSVCPSPKILERKKGEEFPYACIIQSSKDSMKSIQRILVQSDCIIIAGVNAKEDLKYNYQAFMERTRFIRRDNFELTNVPIIGLLINDFEAINNPLHNVKVLTSFIRHNSFMLKPMQIIIN